MALDNTLNIEISAKVDGLKKGLITAEKGVKSFGNQANQMASKTNKMASAVKVNAIPATQEFSRVIQDAPYGIQGVANNIQQLTSQFGYLSAKTGGAKAAFKAMVGSLVGPAGILLAVSVVTSLLVAFGDEIGNMIRGSENAADRIKKLDEAIGDLDVTLTNLKLKKKIADIFGQDTTELDRKKLKGLKDQLVLQKEKLKVALDNYNIVEQEATSLGLFDLPSISKGEQKELNELARTYNSIKNEVDKAKFAIIELEESLSTGKGAEISNVINIDELKNNIKEAKRAIVEPLTALYVEDIPKLQETSYMGMGVDFWSRVLNYENLQIEKDKVLKALEDFNEKSRQIIEGGLQNTFGGIGEGIGAALVNGGNVLQAAGSALLSGLGGIMVDLGKQAIAAGITIEAVKKALTSLSGVGAIAAGVALVAIGSAFKAGAGKLGSSMGSSGAGGYSGGSNSANYGSSTSYSGGGSSGGTYVFEIAGTKLIGVLKNTLDRNKSLGGSNNLVFG